VHEALRAPLSLSGSEFSVDASIGIGLFPTDGEEPEQLIRQADDAMYQSKLSGRGGTLLYGESAQESRASQLALTARLTRALSHGEFELHYQPIVDLASGRCDVVEALIRWRDPERGLVPPGDFIPVVEESGLIEPLGEWVVTEACSQLAEWRRRGLELSASVNLSLRELRRTDLGNRISGAVKAAGLPPGSLIVEITESAAMTELARVREIVVELRGHGIAMAIDDFGAGYSSLGRLREVQEVETLKIDRSFVNGVPDDDFAKTLVAGIIEISHGLGLTPLAEGIETAEQRQFLVDSGCPLGQGFHFSRPLEPPALEEWIALGETVRSSPPG
jgi:EAL domain-containing protein (putative c-di-GMP-specific phosphodiesterase class I)